VTMPDELAFPLDTLLAAGSTTKPLDVCPLGHLRVTGRTCWRPTHFAPDLRAVVCTPVDPHH
jgi:hypothetical protein